MASRTMEISGITRGQYMSWFVTTQAANLISVRLYDDSTTYFNASKQSIDINPPLAIGSSFVQGDRLRLEITSSGYNSIKVWHNTSDISTDSGRRVGKVFVLSGEDYIDDDYNDVYVSISAWDKAY